MQYQTSFLEELVRRVARRLLAFNVGFQPRDFLFGCVVQYELLYGRAGAQLRPLFLQ